MDSWRIVSCRCGARYHRTTVRATTDSGFFDCEACGATLGAWRGLFALLYVRAKDAQPAPGMA